MATHRGSANGWALTLAGFGLALAGLHAATQSLLLPVAYAVFTAIGTRGTVANGVLFFNETMTRAGALWIASVVLAIISLKSVDA